MFLSISMFVYYKIKATTRSFLFSPPPTPPHKIQITTPFGSNEIILIEESEKQQQYPSSNQKSYFTSRHNSLTTTSSHNICCLCSNLIPNTLSRSESQILKNFKMNASPNFIDSKTSVGSSTNSSEQICFKTARSKSYCCQSTSLSDRPPSEIQIDQNFLNASFNVSSNSSECNDNNSTKKSSSDRLKYNLSSTSLFQSSASVDDRNKLNLPGKLTISLLNLKVIFLHKKKQP